MINKEQNFASAVVYIGCDDAQNLSFLDVLNESLQQHFAHYEIICVAPSKVCQSKLLRQWAASINAPITLLTMSLRQPLEQCMNAGLDMTIGDYVYEFDTTEMPYPQEMIWQAYERAMAGNDIVAVSPEKTRSKLFYRLFNRHSYAEYEICTDAFRLVSRRAINRAHAINENLPYRKAAYAACGLKMATITFQGVLSGRREAAFRLASDSLVLYTDFGYRFSIRLTLLMMAATLAELIYTLVIWLTGNPISGWTTTMFVLTMGMTGMFAVLAMVLKYLTLLVKLVFEKQSYLIEDIEKL